MARAWLWLLGLCAGAGLLTAPADAQVALCHDQARDVVTETLEANCTGKVVSAEEAAKIRARRAEQVKKALQPSQSAFQSKRLVGSGTGFFVSARGEILTNQHVIDGCEGITVSLMSGEVRIVKLIDQDEENDLALLGAAMEPPAIAEFNRVRNWQVGDQVTVVGFPVQGMVTLWPVATSGQLTRSTARGANPTRMEIAAYVRRGNSGGPVLDGYGLVIGVIYARADSVKRYQETRRIAPDAAIAIDQRTALSFLQKNEVTVRYGDPAVSPKPADLVTYARRFMTRVQCYR